MPANVWMGGTEDTLGEKDVDDEEDDNTGGHKDLRSHGDTYIV